MAFMNLFQQQAFWDSSHSSAQAMVHRYWEATSLGMRLLLISRQQQAIWQQEVLQPPKRLLLHQRAGRTLP